MQLTSPAFHHGATIPGLYTCEGKNINPPLHFASVPSGAASLVLIMDDPDVPTTLRPDGMYDHWVIFNIPPETTHLEANSTPSGIQGKNTGGKNRYTGPCPPDREHRYFFKLYALDCMLNLKEGASKKEVEEAMQEHIIAECTLMGRYEKGKGYLSLSKENR